MKFEEFKKIFGNINDFEIQKLKPLSPQVVTISIFTETMQMINLRER